ncbi:helix-turn-helix domain-containing protein [Burkholderia pseudomallei]|nr:helix-turn-helix domain-containing protein [Burkholderia pseudomallei]
MRSRAWCCCPTGRSSRRKSSRRRQVSRRACRRIARGWRAGGDAPLECAEAEYIRRALDRHRGNLTAAANQLGIAKHTLYERVRKYDPLRAVSDTRRRGEG